jgi:putative endonuclease
LKKETPSTWCVYILECSDKSLYTGSTNNIQARILKHNTGKGAKYTRGRGPVILKAVFECKNKSEALKREHAIKKLRRNKKLLELDIDFLFKPI